MKFCSRLSQLSDRGKGIALALIGVMILSPDSLLIRLAGLDDYRLIFYRGLFPVFAISLILALYYRRDFPKALFTIGWAGVLNGVFFAAINISFISAIQRTSVANTLLLLASAPVFAAILSIIVLHENLRPSTWVILLLSLLSILIIGWGSYGNSNLLGDFFALCCAVFTACSAVLVRYRKSVDLVPSVVLGSCFTSGYALLHSPELSISVMQLVYVGLIGLVLIPVAFILLTIAPRFANSAEVQLVYLLESILGPLWVALVIRESPPLNTMIGGTMLLLSVAWFAHHTIKQESAPS